MARGRGRGRGSRSGNASPIKPLTPSQPEIQYEQSTASRESSSAPNFTTDVLHKLSPEKQNELMNLVRLLKSKTMSKEEFLRHSRQLVGETLFSVLQRGMNLSKGSSTSNASPAPQNNKQMAEDIQEDAINLDLNRTDSFALQDVMQYAGIDLQAEEENILMSNMIENSNIPSGRDSRCHYEYFFNSVRIKEILTNALLSKGISDMAEGCFDMIALAIKRKISNVFTVLVDNSKHRCEYERARFKVRAENDPSKQLWLIEQYLKKEDERVQSGQGSFGTTESLALARARAKRSEKKATEDIAVKTKLANVTAAVASGLQMKSWMTDYKETTMVNEEMPVHFSQASSEMISDRDLYKVWENRNVSLEDLLCFMRSDPRLCNSSLYLRLTTHPSLWKSSSTTTASVEK